MPFNAGHTRRAEGTIKRATGIRTQLSPPRLKFEGRRRLRSFVLVRVRRQGSERFLRVVLIIYPFDSFP